MPFIFQILLLLALPLAIVYVISLAGLFLMWLRAAWKALPRRPHRRRHAAPSDLR